MTTGGGCRRRGLVDTDDLVKHLWSIRDGEFLLYEHNGINCGLVKFKLMQLSFSSLFIYPFRLMGCIQKMIIPIFTSCTWSARTTQMSDNYSGELTLSPDIFPHVRNECA